jgi:hypothetical protein
MATFDRISCALDISSGGVVKKSRKSTWIVTVSCVSTIERVIDAWAAAHGVQYRTYSVELPLGICMDMLVRDATKQLPAKHGGMYLKASLFAKSCSDEPLAALTEVSPLGSNPQQHLEEDASIGKSSLQLSSRYSDIKVPSHSSANRLMKDYATKGSYPEADLISTMQQQPSNYNRDAARDSCSLSTFHPGCHRPSRGIKVDVRGPQAKVRMFLDASANQHPLDASATLHPIVIPSQGRPHIAHLNIGAPHVDLGESLVLVAVEPDQYEAYAEAWPDHLLLILPESEKAMQTSFRLFLNCFNVVVFLFRVPVRTGKHGLHASP